MHCREHWQSRVYGVYEKRVATRRFITNCNPARLPSAFLVARQVLSIWSNAISDLTLLDFVISEQLYAAHSVADFVHRNRLTHYRIAVWQVHADSAPSRKEYNARSAVRKNFQDRCW